MSLLLHYTETQSSIFGDKMHEQVEERLKFYESGEAPRKNVDVMKEAISEVTAGQTSEKKKKKKKKKEKNGLNETHDDQKNLEEALVEASQEKMKSTEDMEEGKNHFMPLILFTAEFESAFDVGGVG